MSIHLAGLVGTAFGFLFSAGLIKAAALPAVVVASRRNGGFGERLLRGTRIYPVSYTHLTLPTKRIV